MIDRLVLEEALPFWLILEYAAPIWAPESSSAIDKEKELVALLKQKMIHNIEELSNSAEIQIIVHTDKSSKSKLDNGGSELYFIHPNGKLESYSIFTSKISTSVTSEFMAIKGALDNYHNSGIYPVPF
ncbi:uncharacterized protein TNCV_4881071 [Trichonephila clavipes]|nr:uncharacterized protein TNCV_4881071 [Trichonephila clavipes]